MCDVFFSTSVTAGRLLHSSIIHQHTSCAHSSTCSRLRLRDRGVPFQPSFLCACLPELRTTANCKDQAFWPCRFGDNEMAKKLGAKFYCGAPLVGTSGQRLGTLSFVDDKPRKFPAEQLTIFGNMCAFYM